jgi:serine/threonine protein kinase
MRRAVIVGINEYDTAPRLAGCVRDANEIASVLSEPEYGFEPTLLLDGEATRRSCLETLWAAAESDGEILLMYFAGHGGLHTGGGYLATTDGAGRDPGIGLHELAQVMAVAATSYAHVIAILDACHSGAGTTWTDHRPLTAHAVSESIEVVNSSRILMAACRPEQYAYEVNEPAAHGAFTKVLLDALAGDAVNFDGKVTVHGLFEAVSSRMDTELQTPVFKGDSAGSVTLGSGFAPREGAPIASSEKAELLAKAERFLDEYQLLQTRELSRADHRRVEGLSTCARSLGEIVRWFDATDQLDRDILRDSDWKRYRHSLLNYQSALASVGVGDALPLGVIERHVGGGGFGHVWAVRGEGDRPFAYKVFHGSELSDATKAKRFRNGYFSMRRLSHPRIVAVHELTEAPLGFSMDLVDGADLRDAYVDRTDASTLLTYALDIADTIRFAHGAGVIHRDIKPENVLMAWDSDAEGFIPQLTDFDLAYIETNRTVTINMVGGVVNYAAPEQFYANGSPVARSVTVDIYAFGQLLFFLLVGSDPSPDQKDANLARFRQAVSGAFSHGPAETLIQLYTDATQLAPEARPQSMAEVCSALTSARIAHETLARQTSFNPGDIAKHVAYAYVGPGRFSVADDSVSFPSRAGTLAVKLRPRGVASDQASDFILDVAASQDFGVPGAGSGAQARKILNQRLDKRLRRFGEVTRTPGSQGYFQTHLTITGVPLTAQGVARVSDILSSAIGAIEQLD